MNHNRGMSARWWAFGLWAAAAALVVFWALKFFVPTTTAPNHTVVAAAAAMPRGDLTRLFGADAPEPVDEEEEAAPAAESSRFQLLGVVAPKGGSTWGQGVALIVVDGKPAKAFRVGAVVDGDLVLREVRQRGADLGPRTGDARVALEVPPLAAAATGTLPAAGANLPPPPPGALNGTVPAFAAQALPGAPGVRPGVRMPPRGVVPVQPVPPAAVPGQAQPGDSGDPNE